MKENIKGLQHIGIPTEKYDETKSFYEKLGFIPYGETIIESSHKRVVFMKQNNIEFEIYEVDLSAKCYGAIDHIAIDVKSIKEAYLFIEQCSFTILEKGIMELPFKQKGVRYFTIVGPNEEKIEFYQLL